MAESLTYIALAYAPWIVFSYLVILAVYRLYFSPIAKFPGPKLAALTLWYEFYYDVVLVGQYTFHIQRLHEKYGPIVRINPYELHILDPSYYSTLYASSASGEKRDKWGWYTKQFGTPDAMFSTASHEQHRARRTPLNRFFSKASVRNLQPVVDERIHCFLGRLREAKKTSATIPVEVAFSAFTSDVVNTYLFGESERNIERDDWGHEYHDAIITTGKSGSVLKQMIWIYHIINALPVWIQTTLSPGLASILNFQRQIERIIVRIKGQSPSSFIDLKHPTLFHELLQSKLSESDKSTKRLRDEGSIVAGAGTITTSWALSVATFHLLASSKILSKLKAELETKLPSPDVQVSLAQVEELPYLTAVIQESLRLSYGVCSRLQRISPDKPLVYTEPSGKSWVIPKGTPVGMTSVHIHHDEAIFPDSHSFRPERWLEDPRLDKYLVSFSKGSRQCIGINLAYAEMYLCLAGIFRNFGSAGSGQYAVEKVKGKHDEGVLQLLSYDECEVKLAADGFLPLQSPQAKGIKCRVL